MLEDLKKEIHSFLDDMEKNLKDKDDLLYVRERSVKLVDTIMNQIENIMDFKEDRINAILKRQEQEEAKLQELKERIDTVYEDIYEEDIEDCFSIICPYCNHEFDVDIDENYEEIRCPECDNIIELDWDGNPDDEPDNGCSGNCSHCGGCQ